MIFIRVTGWLITGQLTIFTFKIWLEHLLIQNDLLLYNFSFDIYFSGELKMMIAIVSGIEAKEQRLLFRGKEREDREYLHMIGVGDGDKVFLLQDPAFKELKHIHLPITV